jgi:hypothetical protein
VHPQAIKALQADAPWSIPTFSRFYNTRSKKGGDKDSTPFIVIGKKSD